MVLLAENCREPDSTALLIGQEPLEIVARDVSKIFGHDLLFDALEADVIIVAHDLKRFCRHAHVIIVVLSARIVVLE